MRLATSPAAQGPRVVPAAVGPAPGPMEAQWKLGAAAIPGTGILFLGYLLLTSIEYLGLANHLPILKLTRFSTLLSYALLLLVIVRVGKFDIFRTRAAQLLVGFLVITIASVSWAYVRTYAVQGIRPFVDYLGFMVLTGYLLDRRSRFVQLGVLTSIMIVVLLVLNVEKLGGARVGHFDAPFFMGDGNDLAWWLTIALPIAIALVFLSKSRLVQLIGLGGGGVAMLGIMGTGSRGAAMGVAAALLYAWLFVAKKKAVGAIAVAMALVGAAVMAPAGYFERLKTVTEYEQDNSAQARLQAWTGGIHMAIDHPLGVGAGNFSSAYGRFYLPSADDSRLNWGQNRWFNAHSIYFKVLGEYGFPGLMMLFGIIGTLLYQNHRTRVKILSVTSGSPPLDDRIPALLNMSTIGFAVAGTFLSGFNYPHVFFLAGISFAVQRIVDLEYAEGPVAARAGAAAGTAPAAAVDKPRPVLPGGVRVPALGRAHQPARRTR